MLLWNLRERSRSDETSDQERNPLAGTRELRWHPDFFERWGKTTEGSFGL